MSVKATLIQLCTDDTRQEKAYPIVHESGVFDDNGNEVITKIKKTKPTFTDLADIPQIKTPADQWIEQINSKGTEIIKTIQDTYSFLADGEGVSITKEFLAEQINSWLEKNPETLIPKIENVKDNTISIQKLVVGTLGYVTPQMFGAVGDGVTDDLQAFKNMLQFESSFYVIPNGEYYLSDSINIDKSDVNIMMGSDVHIFTNTKTSLDCVICIGDINGEEIISNITISGGTISNTNSRVDGISITYAKNVKIMNTIFTNITKNAISVLNAVENVVIRDIVINKTEYSGIDIEYDCSDIVIDNVKILNSLTYGIKIYDNIMHVTINNVEVNAGGSALLIDDSANVTVTNSKLYSSSTSYGCVYSKNTNISLTDTILTSTSCPSVLLYKSSAKICKCNLRSHVVAVNYSLAQHETSNNEVNIDNCYISALHAVDISNLNKLNIVNSEIIASSDVFKCEKVSNTISITNNFIIGSIIFTLTDSFKVMSAHNNITFSDKLFSNLRPDNMNDYVNGELYIVEDTYMRTYSDASPEATHPTTKETFADNDICYNTDLWLEDNLDAYIGKVFYSGQWYNFGKIEK